MLHLSICAPADQRGNVRVAYLGLDDEKGADATRQAIWAEVMKRYDFAWRLTRERKLKVR